VSQPPYLPPQPFSPPPMYPPFAPGTPGPRRRRGWVWALAVFVIVVITVVGGVVVFGRSDSDGKASIPTTAPPSATTRPADSHDVPAGLISVVDPVCGDYAITFEILAQREQSYAQIDQDTPASQWTPAQRDVIGATVRAIQTAVDQYIALQPEAENRVVQELLAQTIVYLKATAQSLPNYIAGADRYLPQAATGFGGALRSACEATSVVNELPPQSRPPSAPQTVAADPSALTSFMPEKDPICTDYIPWFDRRDNELRAWYSRDQSTPASQWSAEQRALNDQARTVLLRNVGEAQEFASRTTNPVLRDFLDTLGPYSQAIADALPAYVPDNASLWGVVAYLGSGIHAACRAP
jgi:hypothetical protein